jgi:hypothetical protein
VHDQTEKPQVSACETQETTVCGVIDRVSVCARIYSTVPGIYYRGMFRFNPASGTWALMSSPNTRPGPRHMHGLAATPDGLIYCFAGYAIENFEGGERSHAAMIM